MIQRLIKQNFINDVLTTDLRDNDNIFYITKDRDRLFLKDIKVLRYYEKLLRRGERCYKYENKGIVITYGLADKSDRKYLKFLYADAQALRKLLIGFFYEEGWRHWYIKIRKNSAAYKILLGIGFRFAGDRGAEVLLCRQQDRKRNFIIEGDKE
jgi:hypothetical protein